MNKFDGKLFLSRNKEVSWTELDAKIALINIQNQKFYTLNETGALIWKWANGKHTLDQLTKKLAKKCETSEKKVKKDVHNLLSDLIQENLVSLVKKSL